MRFPKLLLYLLLAMIALIAVAELVVRLAAPQPLDPGHTFVLHNEIDGLKPEVEFLIDANHVRGFDSNRNKPEGTVRILCVGGGATATMLQNVDDTWWGRVGKGLEKSLGKPVQIGCLVTPAANGIIGGAQWADYLLDRIDGVDLVIAMYGHAEVLQPGFDFSFDPNAIRPVEFEHKGSFMHGVAKSSHLVRIVRNRHVKSKRKGQESMVGAPNFIRDRFLDAGAAFRMLTATTGYPPRKTDPIDAYLHGIGLFIESARRHQVGLLVVGEPTVFSASPLPGSAEALYTPVQVGAGPRDLARPLPDWVDAELGRYFRAGQKLCEAAGVGFVNLQGVVLADRENFFTETTLTDRGAGEAAKELSAPVEQALIQHRPPG